MVAMTSAVSRWTTVMVWSSAMARTRLPRCGADAEVVHAAGSADADLAAVADVVVADPVVAGCSWAGRERFRGGLIGVGRGCPVVGAVGAVLVVVVPEPVESGLQIGQGAGGRLLSEPAFQGLVEAFDLALGLRVPGVPVLLRDAQERQEVFEGVAAAAEAGGVDAAVVGEGGRGCAVLVDGREEGGDDVVAGDRGVRGAGEQVAGVVVEPAQDLDVGAVGEAPVREVRPRWPQLPLPSSGRR